MAFNSYTIKNASKILSVLFVVAIAGLYTNIPAYADDAPALPLPTITLLGPDPINLTVGDTFVDPGFTATDGTDGSDIVTFSRIVKEPGDVQVSSVDTSAPGWYIVGYIATNPAGSESVPRDVMISPRSTPLYPPTITLIGPDPLDLTVGETFTDPGVTVTDGTDGSDIVKSSRIVKEPGDVQVDSIDTSAPGSYVVGYIATNSAGGAAVPRDVIVNAPVVAPVIPVPPTITLIGDNPLTLTVGNVYDPGFTATNTDGSPIATTTTIYPVDSCNGATSATVPSMDENATGTYIITYMATSVGRDRACRDASP